MCIWASLGRFSLITKSASTLPDPMLVISSATMLFSTPQHPSWKCIWFWPLFQQGVMSRRHGCSALFPHPVCTHSLSLDFQQHNRGYAGACIKILSQNQRNWMQRKYIHLPREWVNPQVHCIQVSLAGTGGWCSFVDRVVPVESTPVAFVLLFLCDKILPAPGEWRLEQQELRVILCYTVRLGLAWIT